MPHLTPENSANLAHDASIGQLCQALAQCLDAQRKHDQRVYPLGDICMRALRCEQYYVADGHGNAASLHANLNFDARRSGSAKNAIGNALFARIRQHLAAEFERHGPSLQRAINEFSETGMRKHNNPHARLKTEWRHWKNPSC